MKIILLQDIKTLGKAGDVKEIAEGYARNFLLPKKMAEVATEEAVKNIQAKKEKESAENAKKTEELKKLAEKLKNQKITIKSKAKKGKLFGSINAKNIAEALQKENLNISEKFIIIEEAIKKIGEYKVKLKLAEGIETAISLKIEEEK